MSFSLYAHRLTVLLISAFTFTFSPSQVFSSFYLIYIFSARAEEIYDSCDFYTTSNVLFSTSSAYLHIKPPAVLFFLLHTFHICLNEIPLSFGLDFYTIYSICYNYLILYIVCAILFFNYLLYYSPFYFLTTYK